MREDSRKGSGYNRALSKRRGAGREIGTAEQGPFHTHAVCLRCLNYRLPQSSFLQSRVLPNVKDIYDGDLSPFGFNYSYANPFWEGGKTMKEMACQDV